MDLMQSDEQRSIVASVADVLTEELSIERVRAATVDGGGLREFWRQAGDLGWFGLGLDESLGGTGYGLVEEALMFREVGRHLTPGPLLASVLGARTAAVARQPNLAAAILAGLQQVGLAVPQPDGSYVLIDATAADHLLVTDPTGAWMIEAAAARDRAGLPSIDELSTRERCQLDLAAPEAFVPAETESMHVRGDVLTSAMLVGIAEATATMSTEYAKTREQFGSPIGAFQSIKHRCADMAIGAATAEAQLLVAALSVAEASSDLDVQVAAARETVQVFGGMGFTAECEAHYYVKRVHTLSFGFGNRYDRQRTLLGLPARSTRTT
jgi:alkylation response protein AidB-like acyl-CoA dehydrogenase